MREGFLSRWSRRKQAALAAEPAKSPPQPESAAAPASAAESRAPESGDMSGAPRPAAAPGVAAFDPSSLPSIESITAATDIRGFFAAGVPAELTRAALRRVWTSDPKIRDFVGLADYDWDFNAPGSMAGFGPLEGAEALRARLAHRLDPVAAPDSAAEMPDQAPAAQPAAFAPADPADQRPEQASQISTEDERPQKTAGARAGGEPTPPEHEDAAQPAPTKPEDIQSAARRRHGGALPES
jgi:hypothetical protein